MAQYLNNKDQIKPLIDKYLENLTFGRSMDFVVSSAYLPFFLCRQSSHIYSDNDVVITPITSKRFTTIVFTYFQLRLHLDLLYSFLLPVATVYQGAPCCRFFLFYSLLLLHKLRNFTHLPLLIALVQKPKRIILPIV